MTLMDMVRDSVALANTIATTEDLTSDIMLEAWTGYTSGAPTPTYAAAVTIAAIVEQGPRPFRDADGETHTVAAVVHILQPVTANGATGRAEPIDPRDRITLPSGERGAPVMGAAGFVDKSTNRPVAYTVGVG